MTASILPFNPERPATKLPLHTIEFGWTYEYNVHGTCLFEQDIRVEVTMEAGDGWHITEIGVERWCVRKGGMVLRWLDHGDFAVAMIRDHLTHNPEFICRVAEVWQERLAEAAE